MAFGIDTTAHRTGVISSASPQTWTHTCGASANKILALNGYGSGNILARESTSCSYNSVSMGAAVTEGDDGGWCHSEIYALNNPGTGSAFSFSVPTAQTPNIFAAYSVSFIDAHADLRGQGSLNGTTANPAITGITTVAGDIVVGILSTDNATGDTAVSGSGVLIFEDENLNSDVDMSCQYVVASGASTDISWTNSGTGSGWAISYVVVKAASAGAAVKTAHLHRQMRN
jgi:hypothetical protein